MAKKEKILPLLNTKLDVELYLQQTGISVDYLLTEAPLFVVFKKMFDTEIVFYENTLNSLYVTPVNNGFLFPFVSYSDNTHFTPTSFYDESSYKIALYGQATKITSGKIIAEFLQKYNVFDNDTFKELPLLKNLNDNEFKHFILDSFSYLDCFKNAEFLTDEEFRKTINFLFSLKIKYKKLSKSAALKNYDKRFFKIITLPFNDGSMNIIPLHTNLLSSINKGIQSFNMLPNENKFHYFKQKEIFNMYKHTQNFSNYITPRSKMLRNPDLSFSYSESKPSLSRIKYLFSVELNKTNIKNSLFIIKYNKSSFVKNLKISTRDKFVLLKDSVQAHFSEDISDLLFNVIHSFLINDNLSDDDISILLGGIK